MTRRYRDHFREYVTNDGWRSAVASLAFMALAVLPSAAWSDNLDDEDEESPVQALIHGVIASHMNCFGDGRGGDLTIDWDDGTATARGRTLPIIKLVGCATGTWGDDGLY